MCVCVCNGKIEEKPSNWPIKKETTHTQKHQNKRREIKPNGKNEEKE